MAKIFKCKCIPYYITGCPTKVMATIVEFKNRWGVTPGDLIEVESIDDANAHVVDKSKFYPE